ncbi:MAG TPA: hypothetical protein VFN25_00715 [Dokdonella sp.]|uniref:hypothetical protein n=1 Tax=Dokdonella sp. TaxID=2291710 RepID=UPI002D7FDAF8|nr:hypothetical protein [Dokdonella sp.]HET9031402.1 hypothetical protein [Dokdonella sp.]
MLLAPFTLTETATRTRRMARTETRLVPLWLQIWAIGGILASVLFPSLRGGDMTGMSLPFWLVAAPLINIAWLVRSRGLLQLRSLLKRRSHTRRSRRIR